MNILELIQDRPDAVITIVPSRYIRPAEGSEMYHKDEAQRWVMEFLARSDFMFENHGEYITLFKSRDPNLCIDLNMPSVDDDEIAAAAKSLAALMEETS